MTGRPVIRSSVLCRGKVLFFFLKPQTVSRAQEGSHWSSHTHQHRGSVRYFPIALMLCTGTINLNAMPLSSYRSLSLCMALVISFITFTCGRLRFLLSTEYRVVVSLTFRYWRQGMSVNQEACGDNVLTVASVVHKLCKIAMTSGVTWRRKLKMFALLNVSVFELGWVVWRHADVAGTPRLSVINKEKFWT